MALHPSFEGVSMPQYLGQFRYTGDAVRSLMGNPTDRSAAAKEVAESLGGSLVGFWFSFGRFDGTYIVDLPDNAAATALAMTIGSSGAIADVETTVLLGMDEAQEAMRRAGAATYTPPGG
jgi:uncharacterized protein with GYD domain